MYLMHFKTFLGKGTIGFTRLPWIDQGMKE